MNATTLLVSLIAALATILSFYFYLSSQASYGGGIVIQGDTIDTKDVVTSPAMIIKSNNQDTGLTFSYAGWILVNDFNYKSGTIFSKSDCPSVSIDLHTNTFLVKINTFGMTETIPINNLPAKKWIHLAIVVQQNDVDIYINGVLYTHHVLSQLPRQNDSSVVIGSFDGKISNLVYYPYVLTDIMSLVNNSPNLTQTTYPSPPYFDPTWWSKKSS